jgi:ribose-phosphate pyrophosphokinase
MTFEAFEAFGGTKSPTSHVPGHRRPIYDAPMPRGPVIFALDAGCGGEATHVDRLVERLGGERGALELRCFPDGEHYLRVDSDVAGREVIIVSTLHQPGEKFLRLAFLAATARDLGAARVGLVAPYLAFMRQDSRFKPGEAVTAVYFGAMMSRAVDWLVTVDPHLHRLASLDAVYSIPTAIARAAGPIAAWIRAEIPRPVLVGPDAESAQWVAAVAAGCDAPYVVLEKIRSGDREVSVSAPALDPYRDRTPVLVDDIISTARTMIEATKQIRRAGGGPPTCIGIHAVFADSAHADLLAAGAQRVVTCDTIAHATNAISIGDTLADAVQVRLGSLA